MIGKDLHVSPLIIGSFGSPIEENHGLSSLGFPIIFLMGVPLCV